jgi:hypothetical protein
MTTGRLISGAGKDPAADCLKLWKDGPKHLAKIVLGPATTTLQATTRAVISSSCADFCQAWAE